MLNVSKALYLNAIGLNSLKKKKKKMTSPRIFNKSVHGSNSPLHYCNYQIVQIIIIIKIKNDKLSTDNERVLILALYYFFINIYICVCVYTLFYKMKWVPRSKGHFPRSIDSEKY